MRLPRSMMRLALASTLLGVERAGKLVRGVAKGDGPRNARTTRRAMDRLAWSADDEIDGRLRIAWQVGDELAKDWVDFGVATVADTLRPRRWRRRAELLRARGDDLLRLASPGYAGRLARGALRDKLEVYRWVEDAPTVLGYGDQPIDLAEAVERARHEGRRAALWLFEGLGLAHARRALDEGLPLDRLFARAWPSSGEIPADAVAMLHVGLGLALGEHVLRRLGPSPRGERVDDAVDRFLDLCERASEPDDLDLALEAFGMVARFLHPRQIPGLDAAIRRRAARRGGLVAADLLIRFFWHGVGRGLYFLPIHYVPGYDDLGRALARCEDQSCGGCSGTARRDLRAGLAYAFTMVHMETPEVMEQAMERHGDALADQDFVAGVTAALVVRPRVDQVTFAVDAFLDHEPADELAARWYEIVVAPYERALDAADGGDPDPYADWRRTSERR